MDRYRIIKHIGDGSFSNVYEGINTSNNQPVAIKVMKLSASLMIYAINEINTHKSLDHPHIVKLIDSYNSAPNEISMVLELCDDSLRNIIDRYGPIPEAKARWILLQIISALKYLYSKSIVHRDIKPHNILLHNDIVKITDFGFARLVSDNEYMKSYLGSPLYMSPELLKGQPYNSKSDIWSLGVLYYEMVTGANPFSVTTKDELIKLIDKPIDPPNISDKGKNFLLSLLAPVNKRISWDELFDHKYLSEDIDGIYMQYLHVFYPTTETIMIPINNNLSIANIAKYYPIDNSILLDSAGLDKVNKCMYLIHPHLISNDNSISTFEIINKPKTAPNSILKEIDLKCALVDVSKKLVRNRYISLNSKLEIKCDIPINEYELWNQKVKSLINSRYDITKLINPTELDSLIDQIKCKYNEFRNKIKEINNEFNRIDISEIMEANLSSADIKILNIVKAKPNVDINVLSNLLYNVDLTIRRYLTKLGIILAKLDNIAKQISDISIPSDDKIKQLISLVKQYVYVTDEVYRREMYDDKLKSMMNQLLNDYNNEVIRRKEFNQQIPTIIINTYPEIADILTRYPDCEIINNNIINRYKLLINIMNRGISGLDNKIAEYEKVSKNLENKIVELENINKLLVNKILQSATK